MKPLIVFLISCLSLRAAAFGPATAWDIQASGADTNGGAFDSGVGSPSTDESTGAGTAITVTSSGTTGTGSPAFSATTHGPGNFIHIASGSGCTVGWYEIVSQSAGTATFNVTMGTGTCVGVIGGPLATIQQANTNSVSLNSINIKAGTYTFTAAMAVAQASISFIGYQTTHGDGGTKPLITTATNSTILFTTAGTGGIQVFDNLSFSNTAGTNAAGIRQPSATGTGQWWIIRNCKFNGFTFAIDTTFEDVDFIDVIGTEVENSTQAGLATGSDILVHILGSYFHGNQIDVYVRTGTITSFDIQSSVFSGSIGNSIQLNPPVSVTLSHNIWYGTQTPSNAVFINAATGSVTIDNCIFSTNNHGIDFNIATFTTAASYASRNNAFFNNTTNYINWLGSPGDIMLSVDPFTNAAGGDFSLNNTAGGGAALKSAGFPATLNAITTNQNVGPMQSAGTTTTQVAAPITIN